MMVMGKDMKNLEPSIYMVCDRMKCREESVTLISILLETMNKKKEKECQIIW